MEGDLSTIHNPIDKNLVSQPTSKEEWAKFKLNKEQIEQFNANGYVTDIPVLNEEQVEYFIKELAPLMSDKHSKVLHLKLLPPPSFVLKILSCAYNYCIFLEIILRRLILNVVWPLVRISFQRIR